jgi:RecA-family ATPase
VKLEHNDQQFVDTMEQLAKGAGLTDLALDVLDALDLDNDDQVAALEKELNQRMPEVVVIDSLRRSTRSDENSSQHVAELARRFHKLTGNGTRLVVVIHHVGKNGTVRGSTDLSAQVDSQLKLSRAPGNTLALGAEHHSSAEQTVLLKLDKLDSSAIRLMTVHAKVGQGKPNIKLRQAIETALKSGPKTSSGLREEVHKLHKAGNDEIDQMLKQMVSEGLARDDGKAGKHQWTWVVLPEPA